MLKNIIKEIKNKYDVNIVYKKHLNNIAEYNDNLKTIIIKSEYKNNINDLIPILFHELGHKYCFDNNIFYHYHNETNLRLAKLTALKAERYVDRWANKEMKKFNIEIDYPMFYYHPNRVKHFKKYINQNLK